MWSECGCCCDAISRGSSSSDRRRERIVDRAQIHGADIQASQTSLGNIRPRNDRLHASTHSPAPLCRAEARGHLSGKNAATDKLSCRRNCNDLHVRTRAAASYVPQGASLREAKCVNRGQPVDLLIVAVGQKAWRNNNGGGKEIGSINLITLTCQVPNRPPRQSPNSRLANCSRSGHRRELRRRRRRRHS